MNKIIKLFMLTVFCLQSLTAAAMENENELAKASNNFLKLNHYAEYIAAPIENDINFGYGPYNNKQNILNFKPVIPFHISSSYDLIVRTIAPIFERTATPNQQNIIDGNYINGWGDINPTFFISPTHFNIITWGVGPTFFLPTSTNSKYIGSGKWSIGPELGMVAITEKWMFGFLTYNAWSVAGETNRPTVNLFSFQYLISYIFDKGWFITSNPTITANWKSHGNQQWTVPFGLGGGRSFNWNKQAISLSTFAYYNAIRPSSVGPAWQWQLELEFLFPPTMI